MKVLVFFKGWAMILAVALVAVIFSCGGNRTAKTWTAENSQETTLQVRTAQSPQETAQEAEQRPADDTPATSPMSQASKQSVAVYMVGKEPSALNGAQKVLGSELAKALTKSNSYSAVDRSQQTIEQIAVEQIYQRSGAVDDDQIKKLGMQIGVNFLCVAEISEVMKSYFLEARLVNVETAEVSSVASMHGNMTNADDVVRIAQAVARQLIPSTGEEIESVFKKRKIADYTYSEIVANPDKAIVDYTEAILQEPDLAEYYLKRGLAYECKKDYDIAVADYTDAIRLDPKEALYYLVRGYAYVNKGDYDRAIIDYNQAIRQNPNDAGAYNNRGAVYDDKGDYDRAIADYNQAMRLNPNYVGTYYNRGNTYYSKRDYDRAIVDYSQAIRLNPNYADAYTNRGIVYKNKGDYDHAIADYSQAIRLNPNNANAYNNRGNAYCNKGDYDRAIADYNQAIGLGSNDADTYYNRGATFIMKDDYDRAISDFESALRINPNHANAKRNLEILRQELRR
jgi:tetratricopeptide (TPR) repeat protein